MNRAAPIVYVVFWLFKVFFQFELFVVVAELIS